MKDLVQVHNPKTDRYTLIDRDKGRILGEKKSPGPYKNVPVATPRRSTEDGTGSRRPLEGLGDVGATHGCSTS